MGSALVTLGFNIFMQSEISVLEVAVLLACLFLLLIIHKVTKQNALILALLLVGVIATVLISKV